MYLFKLQPMYFESYRWQTPDAYKIVSEPDTVNPPFYIWDGDRVEWSPTEVYALGVAVKRGQNLYYSAKADNTDDPFFNYIGLDLSASPLYNDPEWREGKGQESWVKGRGLHDYDCINYISPGATQRRGYMEIQFSPQAMGDASEVTKFYAEGSPYLILHGVAAAEVVLDFYDSAEVLIETKTITSVEDITTQKRIMYDTYSATALHPSLPSILRDTIILPYNKDHTKIVLKFSSGLTGENIKLKHIFATTGYKIGHSVGAELVIGGIDYTRVNYDDWAKMSLVHGKNAKTMKAPVHLIKDFARHEEKIIRLIQSCRATPTLFCAVNNLVLDEYISALPLTFGLVKIGAASEDTTNHRTLDLQIDGMPLDYVL